MSTATQPALAGLADFLAAETIATAFEALVETFGKEAVVAYAKEHLIEKKKLSPEHLAKLKEGREKKAASKASSTEASAAEDAPAAAAPKPRAPKTEEEKAAIAAKRKATLEAKKAAAPAPAEPAAAAEAPVKEKKKLTPEHLAKMKAGREAAAAKKAAEAPVPAAAPVAAAAEAVATPQKKKPAPKAPGAPVKAPAAASDEEERSIVFPYLFTLRDSAVINMMESPAFLVKKFKMAQDKADAYFLEYAENTDALEAAYGPKKKHE